jgi:hypothetical protein
MSKKDEVETKHEVKKEEKEEIKEEKNLEKEEAKAEKHGDVAPGTAVTTGAAPIILGTGAPLDAPGTGRLLFLIRLILQY